MAQQFANGVNSWLHINGGRSKIFDRRGIAPMQAVYQRLARWQDYFRDARSGAQVAVVFSRYTQDSYGRGDPYGRYVDAVRGYYCALLEAHIPFDVLSDKFLDAARLAQYAVLVLPNTACLTDAAVAAITAFAARGGTVVGTYEAGRYDELGVLRPVAPLATMLGGTYGAQRSKLKSSYGYIALRDDPVVDGLGDTDVVPNDGDLIEFTPGPGNIVPLTLIEPVTAHAGATISIPEYSAVTSATDIPVAVYGSHGSGKVVLFTNRMDALFYKYGFADLGRLLSNAVLLGLGHARNLLVVAPDYVDVTQQLQPGRCMVHLINFAVGKHVNTGWRHPGRNLVAVPGIRVRLRLSPGQVMREVRTATDERVLAHTLDCEQAGKGIWAEVIVPRLEDHEIVIFEFA
ncbi:MAG: beta-galactosidase trimerization domain-containing protein [Ramlibacter sp.]|nr:beta-galactosidase trimerization domain-containing protein [Ramlibacter sp.]